MIDTRLPEHRRATFLDFYDFHLRYRAHPGGVYYLIPYLRDVRGWTDEETLWFCVINGNTQNPVSSLLLHEQGPTPEHLPALLEFWRANRERLAWDTDRRYFRTQLDTALEGYVAMMRGPQAQFWAARNGDWEAVWAAARSIPTFGRLSAWSYSEYLLIAGFGADAGTLLLDDLSGSRSHRRGLAIISGHDEWAESASPMVYTPDRVRYLAGVGEALLRDAQHRADADYRPTVLRLTLESALCTYKSWHKPTHLRYPNVYNDMLYDRLRLAEGNWPEKDFSVFWAARAAYLPKRLRLEDSPNDPGYSTVKADHYRLTGEPVVMYAEDPARASEYDRAVASGRLGRFR